MASLATDLLELDAEQAVEEIVAQAGKQFDPEVVAAFRRLDGRSLLDPVEDQTQVRRAA